MARPPAASISTSRTTERMQKSILLAGICISQDFQPRILVLVLFGMIPALAASRWGLNNGMNFFMAHSTKSNPISDFIAQVWMRFPSLNMMSIKFAAFLSAILASIVIPCKDGSSPILVFNCIPVSFPALPVKMKGASWHSFAERPHFQPRQSFIPRCCSRFELSVGCGFSAFFERITNKGYAKFLAVSLNSGASSPYFFADKFSGFSQNKMLILNKFFGQNEPPGPGALSFFHKANNIKCSPNASQNNAGTPAIGT